MITFDCSDPDNLAAWWAKVLDGTIEPLVPGEFVMVARPDGLRLGFQHVDAPTPGKNRVHLDFSVKHLDSEVERLVSCGAVETGRHSYGDEFRWVVFADPEGNAFCVGAGG